MFLKLKKHRFDFRLISQEIHPHISTEIINEGNIILGIIG
jgi:hypothetical protein